MISADQVGIKGDFEQVAGPRRLIPYRSGEQYFHGGVSLQECLVPVLSLTIREDAASVPQSKTTITYKNGAKRITARFPVFDIEADNQQMDLFSAAQNIDVLLEAHTKKGKVVGEAKAGGPVDPSTGTISLKPNDHIKVTLKMQLEFEGKFTVKVINPKTMAIYCKLDLETDYTV